jgi:hypothetical protein
MNSCRSAPISQYFRRVRICCRCSEVQITSRPTAVRWSSNGWGSNLPLLAMHASFVIIS